MRLTKASVSNFKQVSRVFDLGRVTLITGSSRSGKSAMMSAIQAAVVGSVDGIGSANKSLGELHSGIEPATCTVETDDQWRFSVDIRKTLDRCSVSRVVSRDGLVLDESAATKALFGNIPCYASKLMSMSGEDVLSLMLSNKTRPASVDVCANPWIKECKKHAYLVSACSDLERSLGLQDYCAATVESFGAAKALVSYIKDAIDRHQTVVSSENQPYTGPSKVLVDDRIRTLEKLISDHEDAVRMATDNTSESERLSRIIEKREMEIAKAKEIIAENRATIDIMQKCIADVRKVIESPCTVSTVVYLQELRHKAVSLFIAIEQVEKDCGVKLNCSIDTSILDALIASKEKFDNESPRKILADAAVSHINGMVDTSTIMHNPERVLQLLESKLEKAEVTVDTAEDCMDRMREANEKDNQSLIACNVKKALPSVDITPIKEKLDIAYGQRSSINAHEGLEKSKSLSLKMLESLRDLLDQGAGVVESIQDWRKSSVDMSLYSIKSIADRALMKAGLPGLQVDIKSGKRSSVVFRNEAGASIASMAGSERAIYSAVILHAIQTFQAVSLPLVFVEAAEMDSPMLEKFLKAMAECSICGNVIVSHYLNADVEGVTTVTM
jgi:hypothetical protein